MESDSSISKTPELNGAESTSAPQDLIMSTPSQTIAPQNDSEKWQLRIIVHEVVDIVDWLTFPSPYVAFYDYTKEVKILGTRIPLKKSSIIGSTDVHRRCVNKHGLFNYRFVRDFEGRSLVIKMKVLDHHLLTGDRNLGSLKLDLSALPEPRRTAQNVTKTCLMTTCNYLNLFQHHDVKADFPRSVSGYWPLKGRKLLSLEEQLVGKIHLTIQLLTEKESANNPVLGGCPEEHELNILPKLPLIHRQHGDHTHKYIGVIENFFIKVRENPVVMGAVTVFLFSLQIIILVLWSTITHLPLPVILLNYSIIFSFSALTFIAIYALLTNDYGNTLGHYSDKIENALRNAFRRAHKSVEDKVSKVKTSLTIQSTPLSSPVREDVQNEQTNSDHHSEQQSEKESDAEDTHVYNQLFIDESDLDKF